MSNVCTKDAENPELKEAEAFLEKHPEVQFVDLLIADMNGIVRGKRVDKSVLSKVFKSGVALPASIYGLNIQGTTVEETGLGLDIGDSDRICLPVPGTLTMEPWQKRPIAQCLMSMYEEPGEPFFADPRMILRSVVRLDCIAISAVGRRILSAMRRRATAARLVS